MTCLYRPAKPAGNPPQDRPQARMPLSRDELIDLAVNRYFGNVARRDMAGVMAIFAQDAVMRVMTLGARYQGKAAIKAHFDEFLAVYAQAQFADFQPTADVAGQSVAVRFTITLTPADGSAAITMTNCNFFDLGPYGQVQNVSIYMSAAPSRGFDAGHAGH
jgi:ketosteroid isomerase-like protein